MYHYIKGVYAHLNKDYIVIENSGIGYKIFTSGNTISQLPSTGNEVKLYLQQIVREDFLGIYGFYSMDELDLFNRLITISGVGARAALSILSINSVDKLKYDIYNGNDKSLAKAAGVGKKLSQRIILELKDKIKLHEVESLNLDKSEDSMTNDAVMEEAKEALIALGYNEKESEKALLHVNNKQDLQGILKEALKFLFDWWW